jgi:hypothetical protein
MILGDTQKITAAFFVVGGSAVGLFHNPVGDPYNDGLTRY